MSDENLFTLVRTDILHFAREMEKTMAKHDAEHPNGQNDNLDMLYDP